MSKASFHKSSSYCSSVNHLDNANYFCRIWLHLLFEYTLIDYIVGIYSDGLFNTDKKSYMYKLAYIIKVNSNVCLHQITDSLILRGHEQHFSSKCNKKVLHFDCNKTYPWPHMLVISSKILQQLI